MSIVYFDLVGGASGDMILGSLVALGAPLPEIERKLRALPLEGITLGATTVKRHGFDALQLQVTTAETKSHRHFTEIRRMLEGGSLPPRVLGRALGTFELLGRCEAEVHGTSLEKVHFHEVGALDAIVDIVGTAWALEILNVERCHASVIPHGRGFVRAEHGTLPNPAPATVRILEGVPVRMTEIESELTTPTGAALLRTLCDTIGEPVGIRPRRTGVSTGARDLAERPNILRAMLGEPLASQDQGAVEVFETTIDDMNPQLYGNLTESLFQSGAREVFLTPVQMKKGRPGVLVTAICDSSHAHAVLERLFLESTTIGVRVRHEGRVELMRSVAEIQTPLGAVRVKTAVLPTGEERRVPEYEDVKRIAQAVGRPLVEVMEEVRSYLHESARTPV
ncbi:MAG TPA: nickel pincer cofactor biosynthesis protein LarC [Candidatus Limnocylindrales bacterium]|nr:nickel pincer cofactor biosynthesis protein LarC [Candidatus Limnocylindrales bacterium]